MMPTENIKRLLRGLNIQPDASLHERVLRDALEAQAQTPNVKPAPPHAGLWRMIMKRPLAKIAVAAVVVMVLVLSMTLMDKSVSSAYALEQTLKAYEGLRFVHIKAFKDGESEPTEFWVKLDEHEQIRSMRVSIPIWEDPEGPSVAVWNNGYFQVWNKKNNLVMMRKDEDRGLEILRHIKECDPRSVVNDLYQLEAEGKAEIKTSIPKQKSETIVITANSLAQSGNDDIQMVLYVDQKTKLVTRMVTSNSKEQRSIEFSDYNIAIDDSFFTLKEVPTDTPTVRGQERYDAAAREAFLKNINAKLALLDINKSTVDDVIAVLGEPGGYRFEQRNYFDKDHLPETYNMMYPGHFIVSIHKNHVMLWGSFLIPGYEVPGFVFSDSIQLGMSIEDVFKILGQPAKIIDGFKGDESMRIMFEDNVSYANMNINKRKGFSFYRYDDHREKITTFFDDNVLYQKTGNGYRGYSIYGTVTKGKRIRLTFMDNKVAELYEYRTEPIKAME